MQKTIKSALISVWDKEGLAPIASQLSSLGIKLLSTGGTEKYLRDLNIPVTPVEDLTGFPSIFGGRVKTLHPVIFGGILHRRDVLSDIQEAERFTIPQIDLVIVDLYPFEETLASGANAVDIIEKIDIGGVSLLRAAAKNFSDVLVISSIDQYPRLIELLETKNGETTLEERRFFAGEAFATCSHYDSAIFNWFSKDTETIHLRISENTKTSLRYGENPHQKGSFYGDMSAVFEQLHGKELSYNNLVDIDAAIGLINEFPTSEGVTFAILKHTNACGVATAENSLAAWNITLACDPISAFGGVIITNAPIDSEVATSINNLFFEVLLAPSYSAEALEILEGKKNRILLQIKNTSLGNTVVKTLLNGYVVQDRDLATETPYGLNVVTTRSPLQEEVQSLIYAARICKHTKSNAIVFAKENRLISTGTGQTSRIDALNQAVEKARHFGFDLAGSSMASDAFFPFSDCVEAAYKVGVTSVIHPGGSIRDQDSIDFCNSKSMAMVTTGIRHFRH